MKLNVILFISVFIMKKSMSQIKIQLIKKFFLFLYIEINVLSLSFQVIANLFFFKILISISIINILMLQFK